MKAEYLDSLNCRKQQSETSTENFTTEKTVREKVSVRSILRAKHVKMISVISNQQSAGVPVTPVGAITAVADKHPVVLSS